MSEIKFVGCRDGEHCGVMVVEEGAITSLNDFLIDWSNGATHPLGWGDHSLASSITACGLLLVTTCDPASVERWGGAFLNGVVRHMPRQSWEMSEAEVWAWVLNYLRDLRFRADVQRELFLAGE